MNQQDIETSRAKTPKLPKHVWRAREHAWYGRGGVQERTLRRVTLGQPDWDPSFVVTVENIRETLVFICLMNWILFSRTIDV